MHWLIDCREISTHVEVDRRTSLCFQSRRYPGHACRVSVCVREKKVSAGESVICFYLSLFLSLRLRGRGGNSPFLLLRAMVKARGRWWSSPCTTSLPRRTLISRSNRCRHRRTNTHIHTQTKQCDDIVCCVHRERSTSSSTNKTSCGGERRTSTGNYVFKGFMSSSSKCVSIHHFPGWNICLNWFSFR